MRFRRRSHAPPEPEEEDDDRAWARPEGEPPLGEATEEPAPPEEPAHEPSAGAAYQPPVEPAYQAPVRPAYEAPVEPEYQAPEEPVYEPPVEPAYEAPAGPAYELEDEPPAVEAPAPVPAAPVSSWSGGPEDYVSGAEGTVRAAGGVVWSRWQGGLRVVVVHRPRYDDWSLPKGKAGPGESDADCALREVREETGLACSLGEEVASTSYHDRHGRLKTVRYFAMEPLGGSAAPQHEVDEVRWLALEEARRLLSYDRDVAVLDALADMADGGAQHRQEFGPPPEG